MCDRHRLKRKDNIKIYLQEVDCGGMDWIELAQDKDGLWTFLTMVMNNRIP